MFRYAERNAVMIGNHYAVDRVFQEQLSKNTICCPFDELTSTGTPFTSILFYVTHEGFFKTQLSTKFLRFKPRASNRIVCFAKIKSPHFFIIWEKLKERKREILFRIGNLSIFYEKFEIFVKRDEGEHFFQKRAIYVYMIMDTCTYKYMGMPKGSLLN